MASVTRSNRLLEGFINGGEYTVAQAQKKFGLSRVSARVLDLRNAGYSIYTNVRHDKNGKRIATYRMGTSPKKGGRARLYSEYSKRVAA